MSMAFEVDAMLKKEEEDAQDGASTEAQSEPSEGSLCTSTSVPSHLAALSDEQWRSLQGIDAELLEARHQPSWNRFTALLPSAASRLHEPAKGRRWGRAPTDRCTAPQPHSAAWQRATALQAPRQHSAAWQRASALQAAGAARARAAAAEEAPEAAVEEPRQHSAAWQRAAALYTAGAAASAHAPAPAASRAMEWPALEAVTSMFAALAPNQCQPGFPPVWSEWCQERGVCAYYL